MNRPHLRWLPFAILFAVATIMDTDTSFAQEANTSKMEAFSSRAQSDAAIQTVVRKQRNAIMVFYKHQLRYHPHMQGSIKIRLVVKEDGHVRTIEILSDTVKNRALTSYIKKRAGSWEFGKLAQSQVVDLTFPFAPKSI